MPSLDSCLNDIYEPGNIPADPGQTPTIPTPAGVSIGSASGTGAASALPFGFAIGRAYGVGAASAGPVGFAVGMAAGIGALTGSTEWTPAIISTLLWLEADDAATFTFGTGVNVAQWNDKSGNGNHVAQATSGNQPDRDTVTNIIDGKAVVSFDGTDDRIEKSSLSGWPANNGTAVTVAMVFRHRSAGGNEALFDISTGSLTNTTALAHVGSSYLLNLRTTGTSNAAQTATGAITQNAPFVGVFTCKSNKREIWVNGTMLDDDIVDNGTSAYTNLRLGTLFQDVFPILGDMGEFVVVSGDDDTTRQLIEGYLAWKWGLEGDLPGGHPYENSPP